MEEAGKGVEEQQIPDGADTVRRVKQSPYREPDEIEALRRRLDRAEQRLDDHAKLIDEHATGAQIMKLRPPPLTKYQRTELSCFRIDAAGIVALGLMLIPASLIVSCTMVVLGMIVVVVACTLIVWRDENSKRG